MGIRKRKHSGDTKYYEGYEQGIFDDSNLLVRPDHLKKYGPEKAVFLSMLLRAEFFAACERELAEDGIFTISPMEIADETGFSLRKVVRYVDQFSDSPPCRGTRLRYGEVHLIKRIGSEFTISVNSPPS
jgi:hypothetical protein